MKELQGVNEFNEKLIFTVENLLNILKEHYLYLIS